MGNASFLLDELLYSIGPDNGSDQMALVGPRIFLLNSLLSPTERGYHGVRRELNRETSLEICRDKDLDF